jgi:2-hydroxychromene-2-carboxylate isomerase
MTCPGTSGPSEPDGVSILSDPDAPLVVLDLASVETYLLVGILSRNVSEARGALWCPLESEPAELDLDRSQAKGLASDLGLSVTWPGGHWRPVPRAMRVAALALDRGCAPSYMRSMSRVAFGAGMDVDRVSASVEPKRSHLIDFEPYAVAVDRELGLSELEIVDATEQGSRWEHRLQKVASELAELGIDRAPALRHDGQIHFGARAISALLAEPNCRWLSSANRA